MPDDHRYETALRAALGIIYTFDRPGITRPAKLASVTYAVLDAIYLADSSPSAALPASECPGWIGPAGLAISANWRKP